LNILFVEFGGNFEMWRNIEGRKKGVDPMNVHLHFPHHLLSGEKRNAVTGSWNANRPTSTPCTERERE
jgi:hypothetical protein